MRWVVMHGTCAAPGGHDRRARSVDLLARSRNSPAETAHLSQTMAFVCAIDLGEAPGRVGAPANMHRFRAHHAAPHQRGGVGAVAPSPFRSEMLAGEKVDQRIFAAPDWEAVSNALVEFLAELRLVARQSRSDRRQFVPADSKPTGAESRRHQEERHGRPGRSPHRVGQTGCPGARMRQHAPAASAVLRCAPSRFART